jgi:hypothetical protein
MDALNLIEEVNKAYNLHETARRRWFGGREANEEDYRRDVAILEECVRQNQEIYPVRTKIILKHNIELQKYDELKEAFETGNVPNVLRDYFKIFENFDELYRLQETENKENEEMMRNASYVNY